jgi:ubiquinone biosynthesis accessory factor UbiK
MIMQPNPWLDAFQKNVAELISKSPAADVERNVRAFMGQAFTKLDLVTREEFDVQADLLKQTLSRVDLLERQLQALEQRVTALENAKG